ncbi:hypothetical protein ACHQM5_020691 [Ranunculus cassubicifolius]
MFHGKPEAPQDSNLQIKQNDKFFSRLLSKETSVTNPSFRVYYGGSSGTIPFVWESQPGTPKNKSSDTSLPPLTPPPSYQFNPKKDTTKKSSNFKLIHTIFPRLNGKKSHVSPSYSASTSSSSSSSRSSSSLSSTHKRPQSSLSSFDSRGDDEEASSASPTSTICFGRESSRGFKGCYSMMIIKNPFSGSNNDHQATTA